MRRRLSREHEYERINNYFPPHPPLPWSWVEGAQKEFLHPVLNKWKTLLKSSVCRETSCTSHLSDYAGYFLCLADSSFFALREIRLGSEYVIDLAVPRDRYSLGLRYNLIEVEPPHMSPFKANGDKSAGLNHAIDQVQNWRRWLKRHSRMARELFPCWFDLSEDARFDYTIIIGTRENTNPWLERRNEISSELGISIRSHDFLTDRLRGERFLINEEPYIGGSEERGVSPIIKNALGNPFFKAWTDVEWKRVRQQMNLTSHFFVWNADVIIQNRSYNRLLRPFVRFCQSQLTEFPQEVKLLYDSWRQKKPIFPSE